MFLGFEICVCACMGCIETLLKDMGPTSFHTMKNVLLSEKHVNSSQISNLRAYELKEYNLTEK